MRIGIRAHDVKADTFEGLVKEIHNEGMHCCQLAVPKAVHEFPTKKEVLTPGMALYMKEVFAENKVDVAVLGCYQNLATPDEAALKDTIDTYKRHIVFASLLGAGVVGTETGACNTEYRTEPFSFTEEALEIFIKNLRPVVEYAENEEDVNEDAQLVILSVGEDDEGEYLDVVEDDETLLEVSKLFEQRLSEDYDIE